MIAANISNRSSCKHEVMVWVRESTLFQGEIEGEVVSQVGEGGVESLRGA